MSKREGSVERNSALPDLQDEELLYFCEALESRTGIALKSSKRDLVRARLKSRLAARGLGSYREYRELLSSLPVDDSEWQVFTNLLTTNKTDFFREPRHFEYLVQEILPAWLKTGATTFKVWSAASSTGEEAFTLAMVLRRHLPADRSFRILGTDIDTEVIARARNAVYSVDRLQEIPADYRSSIDLGRGATEGWFRIRVDLKDRVQFEPHNLMDATAPGMGVFDLVLCRNVLIYFSTPAIDFVQRKLFHATKTGGHLFIGHSESLQGLDHEWSPIASCIFKKD